MVLVRGNNFLTLWRIRFYVSEIGESRSARDYIASIVDEKPRAIIDSKEKKRKCGEGAFAFVYCLLRAEENRFCHSSCITQHDAMLADNTRICTITREHRISNVHVILYIYIIDYIRTRLLYTLHPFHPLRTSLIQQQSFSIYIYIFFFLIPIYKFYLNLREISLWIKTYLSSAFSKMIMSNAFIILPCDPPDAIIELAYLHPRRIS